MAKELFLVIYNLIQLLNKAEFSKKLCIEKNIYNNPVVIYKEIFILGEEDNPINEIMICYN